jgi:hypothetical protein
MIKSVALPHIAIQSCLPKVKDVLGFNTPGVYSITCGCGGFCNNNNINNNNNEQIINNNNEIINNNKIKTINNISKNIINKTIIIIKVNNNNNNVLPRISIHYLCLFQLMQLFNISIQSQLLKHLKTLLHILIIK